MDPHGWEASQPLSYRSHSFPSTQSSLEMPKTPADWLSPVREQVRQHDTDATAAHSQEHSQTLHVHSPEPAAPQQTANVQHIAPEQAKLQQQLGVQHTVAASNSMKRKSIDSPHDQKTRQTILIWDLDETLILFHSLLSGQYADHHHPEVSLPQLLCQVLSSKFDNV